MLPELILTGVVIYGIYKLVEKITPKEEEQETKLPPTESDIPLSKYYITNSKVVSTGTSTYRPTSNSVNANFSRIRNNSIGHIPSLKRAKSIKGRIMRTGR